MGNFLMLAFKNVFRQKKRSFTLGINYAVVAFILVLLLAFSRGATSNISTSLVTSTAGHITVTGQFAKGGKIYNGLLRTEDIVNSIKKTFGTGETTIVRYGVNSTVYFNNLSKRLSFSGIDTGSDKGLEAQANFTSGSWADFASDPNGVAMPKAEAEYFGLKVGDEIVLSTRTRFGAFNTGILVVRGIYVTDNYFAKSLVLAHFSFLHDLDLAENNAATSIYVYFPSAAGLSEKRGMLLNELKSRGFEVKTPKTDADAIAAISSASTKYEVDKEGKDRVMLTLSTLDEVLGIVRSVLAAVNGVGAFIAAIMLFVIAVSIFINLRMSINERMKEIGTMRAMGVEASGVTGLFIVESVALAILFSLGGAILAAVIALIIRIGPSFPPGVNLGLFLDKGHLVLIPDPLSMIGVVAVISVFAAFFSFFPARRGGSIPPVEALTKTF
jgi:putative ABC transport system permease protein